MEEPYRLSFFFSPSFVATSGRGTSLGLTRSLFPLLLPFRSRRSSAGGRGSLAAIRRSSCPVSFLARLARSSSSSSSSSFSSSSCSPVSSSCLNGIALVIAVTAATGAFTSSVARARTRARGIPNRRATPEEKKEHAGPVIWWRRLRHQRARPMTFVIPVVWPSRRRRHDASLGRDTSNVCNQIAPSTNAPSAPTSAFTQWRLQ